MVTKRRRFRLNKTIIVKKFPTVPTIISTRAYILKLCITSKYRVFIDDDVVSFKIDFGNFSE